MKKRNVKWHRRKAKKKQESVVAAKKGKVKMQRKKEKMRNVKSVAKAEDQS